MCFKINDPADALNHMLKWSLTEIHEVTQLIEKEADIVFPTVNHIINDECWGDKLINLIALVHPVIDIAKTAFPQFAQLISWITEIVEAISKLSPIHNARCKCGLA